MMIEGDAEFYDFGTDIPYTDEDLDVLFEQKERKMTGGVQCACCPWFTIDSPISCNGPLTCAKWTLCAKCCPLTGRAEIIDYRKCPHFRVDPLISH